MLSQKNLKRIRIFFLLVVLVFFSELSYPIEVKSQEYIDVNQENNIVCQNQCKEIPQSVESKREIFEMNNKPEMKIKKTIEITVTAYSSTYDQTDGDPFTTASGTKVRDGVIAANFLPMGTRVRMPEYFGDKIFVVEDRMHPRHWYMADIWMPSREQAKEWGARYLEMEIL